MSQYSNEINALLSIATKKDKKEIKSERAKIMAELAETNARRDNLVKKALGAARAQMGASGASDDTASARAVLKRLAEETAESDDKKIDAANDKLASLTKKYKSRRKNLLSSALKKSALAAL
ncbi:MAG: hypothetical protein LBB23_02370 [Rickettsiales bacterium]|jgi:hypothetical protein|nr:hypothetical protein [Rickettsiales bacterium]